MLMIYHMMSFFVIVLGLCKPSQIAIYSPMVLADMHASIGMMCSVWQPIMRLVMIGMYEIIRND